jgi:hypothetical protein
VIAKSTIASHKRLGLSRVVTDQTGCSLGFSGGARFRSIVAGYKSFSAVTI